MNPPTDYRSKGWGEYQELVLDKLDRLEKQNDGLRDEISAFKEKSATQYAEIKSELRAVKVTSGVLGTLSGTISGALAGISIMFKKG